MDTKGIRSYHSHVLNQLEEIAKRDEGLSPNFLAVLSLAAFTVLTEVAAQLSELKTVIRNANLIHEQKDV